MAQKSISEDNGDTMLKIIISHRGNFWQGWNPAREYQDHAFFLPAIPILANSKPFNLYSKWNTGHAAARRFSLPSKASPAEDKAGVL